MIKVSQVVREILYSSEEALSALTAGYLNYSAYAKSIQKLVEEKTYKSVRIGSIVAALARISNTLAHTNPFQNEVEIKNLTIKSPLVELAYDKTPETLKMLKKFYAQSEFESAEFLTVTQGTDEITIICSEKTRQEIEVIFTLKPKVVINGLVALSVRFDAKYVSEPNVIFSLLRKIAIKKIVIAEVVSTYTELTFLLYQKDLEKVMSSFTTNTFRKVGSDS